MATDPCSAASPYLDEHFKLAVSLSDLSSSVLPLGGKGSPGSSSPPVGKEAPKDLVCEHCNRPGHVKERCWDLHPELAVQYKQKSKKN
jgi:hypothetical protein